MGQNVIKALFHYIPEQRAFTYRGRQFYAQEELERLIERACDDTYPRPRRVG